MLSLALVQVSKVRSYDILSDLSVWSAIETDSRRPNVRKRQSWGLTMKTDVYIGNRSLSKVLIL